MATLYVATTGNDSTGDGSAGNPYATPGKAASVKAQGDDVWVKSGTYLCTNSTANTAGGPVNDSTGGVDSTNYSRWEGYLTTPGDRGARPVLKAAPTASGISLWQGGAYTAFISLEADGNSGGGAATVKGFHLGGYAAQVHLCKATNCTNWGIYCASYNLVTRCQATGTTGPSYTSAIDLGFDGNATGQGFFNEAWGNAVSGFGVGPATVATACLSYANTGSTSHGFMASRVGYCAFCVAYGNGGSGFSATFSNTFHLFLNCVAFGNTGSGFVTDGVKDGSTLLNCAGGSNTSGDYSGTNFNHVEGFVPLGANNPFVNAGSGNFALDLAGPNATGAALLKAAGFGVMPRGLTTGYPDIGAVQHQDSGGGGGVSGLALSRLVGGL